MSSLKISSLCLLSLCLCLSCHIDRTSEWKKEASGVWKLSYGKADRTTLTSELHFTPKTDAINQMEDVPFPLEKEDLSLESVDGKTYIRFQLDKDEHIYGLGLNFKSVDQRGRIMRLHVDHYGGSDNGRTHAPVPFFVSSKGYGAFINAARYIDVYCGTSVRKDSKNPPVAKDRTTDKSWTAQPYSDNLEFLVPSEGVEIVLFAGSSMLDVVRRFNLFNGGGVLPPKWGLGFWQRVPTAFSDKDVMTEIEGFESHGFPLSVIGLEPGWQSRAYPCSYEWDKGRFPDPDHFLNSLKNKGIRTNLWINPGIYEECCLGKEIEPYTASHTEWCGLIPDYTLPKARETVSGHWIREQIDRGVSGYKMDENDGVDSWIFPDVATFPSGNSAEQMRQIYGSLMQDIQNGIFRDRNERSYGLVRSGNAGTSSFPFVIYNDYYNHRDFITALINSSFIGVLWTPEVRSSSTSEEWLRRMQTVCFSPLAMLNAWSDGTKPWSFADVESEVLDAAMLRMQLIPYLYTAFAEYCFHGTPPMRAMNLVEGYSLDNVEEEGELDSTHNPYAMALRKESKDQFMVGEDILVAPVFAGEKERKVILPKGRWYDFYTGEFVGESEIITAIPGLKTIPVYVRDGGIIPMLPRDKNVLNGKQSLEIRHYGSAESSFRLYDDDGLSFDYENGDFSYIDITVSKDSDGQLAADVRFPGRCWSYDGNYHLIFMSNE